MKFKKRFMCILLTLSLVIVSTTSVFATNDPVNTDIDKEDQEILSDIITEIAHINKILEPYELSLDDFVNLPERNDGFYEELEEYIKTNEKSTYKAETVSPSSLEEYGESKLFGDRMAYSMYIASKNKKRDSNALSLEEETVYMYLSHYIDMHPSHVGSRVDNNSNDGYFSAWITNDDRRAYDTYMRIGQVGRVASDVKDSIIPLYELKSAAQEFDLVSSLESAKTKIALGVDVYSKLNKNSGDIPELSKAVKSMAINMNHAKSPEDLILRIHSDLSLEDYSEESKKAVINVVLSITGVVLTGGLSGLSLTLGLNTVNIITMQYKDLYDYVGWLSLTRYVRVRTGNRMYRAWGL